MERNNDISEERIYRYLGTVRYIILLFSNVLTTLHKKCLHPVLTIQNIAWEFLIQKILIHSSSIPYNFMYCCILAIILLDVFLLLRQRKIVGCFTVHSIPI